MVALEDLVTPRMQRGMQRMVTALNGQPEISQDPETSINPLHRLKQSLLPIGLPEKPGKKWIERCLPLRKVAIDNK